jgi:hypothetical protein
MIAMRPARTQVSSEVMVNVFPGGFNWGIYVAQEKGLFAKNGLLRRRLSRRCSFACASLSHSVRRSRGAFI